MLRKVLRYVNTTCGGGVNARAIEVAAEPKNQEAAN
jgi:hypothetical protein